MASIGLDNNWQYVIKGGILLMAVIFEVFSTKVRHKT
jgi:putative multiple sugar transport system permease protein